MQTKLSSYVGHEYAFWERVCLVFEGLGYSAPDPDTPGGGAYVANIAGQYLADLDQDEVLQIIEYARWNTLENLQISKKNGWIDRETVFR